MYQNQNLINVILAYTPKPHFSSNNHRVWKEVLIPSQIELLMDQFVSINHNGGRILEGISECEIKDNKAISTSKIISSGQLNEGNIYLLHLKYDHPKDEYLMLSKLQAMQDYDGRPTFPERSFDQFPINFPHFQLTFETSTLKLITQDVLSYLKK